MTAITENESRPSGYIRPHLDETAPIQCVGALPKRNPIPRDWQLVSKRHTGRDTSWSAGSSSKSWAQQRGSISSGRKYNFSASAGKYPITHKRRAAHICFPCIADATSNWPRYTGTLSQLSRVRRHEDLRHKCGIFVVRRSTTCNK